MPQVTAPGVVGKEEPLRAALTASQVCAKLGYVCETMHRAELADAREAYEQLALDLLGRHALLQHGDEYFGKDHLGHQLDRQSSERNQTQQRNAKKKHRRGHRASYREIRPAQANLPRRRSIVS